LKTAIRKMGLNKNYIVGILDDSSIIPNPTSARKVKELTEFFTRFKYFGKILSGNTVNEILDKALEENKKYCIIHCVGHLIKEAHFFDLLEKWMDSHNFFITGHIMDKQNPNSAHPEGDGYYGLHKQCLLVNLDYYKNFDKPIYGKKENSKAISITKAIRSVHDIHDDYTPLMLKPTDETVVCTPLVDGWNFINKSLENGLIVYNFHPKIREQKQYVYPNKSVEELQYQLYWINNIISFAPTCVFFWNTELYLDTNYISIEKPIDKLYSVAAAFKPNFILNKFGFKDTTEIVFYDYSKQALAFKKMLLEHWNGEDYPDFLRWAKSKYLINETVGIKTENETYEDLWEKELKSWGSAKNFKDHWDNYKKLKHRYIHCDICVNPEKLTSKITNEETQVIWWSNAFHTVNAHYLRGLQGVKTCYNEWLNQINCKDNNIHIMGKDYLNRPVEGHTLKEYLMKISDDKLKLFDNEGDLRSYLKINGQSGNAIEESVNRWKNLNTEDSVSQKTTMVVTETDTTVETK